MESSGSGLERVSTTLLTDATCRERALLRAPSSVETARAINSRPRSFNLVRLPILFISKEGNFSTGIFSISA